MISLDEFNACIKREEIIYNSSNNPAERFMAMNIINSIGNIYKQLNTISTTEDFKKMVEEYSKSENT